MNSYERFMAVLDGKPVDRVPVTPIVMMFSAQYGGRLFGDFCYNYEILAECWMKCREDFGFDFVSTISDPFREASDLGLPVEKAEDDVPIRKGYLMEDLSEMDKVRFVHPREGPRMSDRVKATEVFKKELNGHVPILGWIEGCFAEACDLYPMTNIMMDTIDRPEMVREFLERLLPIEIAFAEAQIEAGADAIGIGDAAASLVSAETYENLILRFEQREVEAIHNAGARVKLHICGNTNHLAGLMWKSGADVIDLDHAVDMPRARKKIPAHIPICGNMDPVADLQDGTPESVTARALEDIRVGAGAYMLAPGCEVPRNTPHENLHAFVRAASLAG